MPLLERAYTLWDELAAERGEVLLERTGLLLFGRESEGGSAREAARAVAKEHRIAVEELAANDVRARFPQFTVPGDLNALWEPGAGFLHVERCVRTHAEAAIARGVDLTFGARVEKYTAHASPSGGVEVVVNGETHRAGALVICPGAWSVMPGAAGGLLADVALPLVANRVVQFWFDAPDALDLTQRMPCYAFAIDGHFVYGFPRLGLAGIKIAEHAPGVRVAEPALVDRNVLPHEADVVKRFARAYLRGVGGEPTRAKTCLYTMSPDEHFVVDQHPRHESVHYACGFSGHGFKFASVMGEVLSERALPLTAHEQRVSPLADFLRNRFAP